MLNRKIRAYSTALRVSLSYLWLTIKSRFFGQAYKRRMLPEVHQRNAERVKSAILDLQGLFVKFGQLVSILANILPEAFREPLASLQDKIPARPYAQTAKTFIENTGKEPEAVFDVFEKTPLAAASIGQVHLAIKEGVRYAVKVQHTDIEAIAKADLQILKRLVAIHSWFMDIKGSDYLYEQIKEMIEQELDYQKEALAMSRLAENIALHPELNVIVPKLRSDLSSKKILVTEYFEGKNISNTSQLEAWGLEPSAVAERLLLLYAQMVLVDGFYHADPHPGNFLINDSGQIALLDFGAVAEISPNLRTGMVELIEAIIKNDTAETVAALKKMGFIVDGAEAAKIAEHLVQIGRTFVEEEVQLDGLDFSSVELKSGMSGIFKLLQKIDLREISSTIQIPKDYVLLYRTIMLLFGLSFQLAPELNPIDTIRPFAQKNLMGKTGTLSQTLLSAAKRQLTTALALPGAIESFLKKANRDELELKVHNFDKNVAKLYQLGQQFLFAVLCGFTYLMADDGRGVWFFWLSGFFGLLFLRAWRKGG